jgi:tripartite-type tricarboxylate transporter receptor subunit TctC
MKPGVTQLLAAVLLLAFAGIDARAADYPPKPIRFIVGFPPGGGGDLIARIVGQGLAEAMNQTVIIDNRAGAGGVIGSDIVAKSLPDGYTLLLGTTGAITISPSLQSKMLYDSRTDFSPVGHDRQFPERPRRAGGLPVAVAEGADRSGEAAAGQAQFRFRRRRHDISHGGEMLRVMAGIDIVHVPYKGNGPAMTDLIAGRLDCMFPTLPSALTYLKADRLRRTRRHRPSAVSRHSRCAYGGRVRNGRLSRRELVRNTGAPFHARPRLSTS